MFNLKKSAMKLTKDEINLFRSIGIAIFRAHWYDQKIIKEKIIESAKGLESIYSATPVHLQRMLDLYSADLTNEAFNLAYLKVLEIFLEMRADL